MPYLQQYMTHAEKFGPECIVLTAVQDATITIDDLAELKAWLEWKHKAEYWQEGRSGKDGQWRSRKGDTARQCDVCGLDLPVSMRSDATMHPYCRNRRRMQAKRANKAKAF